MVDVVFQELLPSGGIDPTILEIEGAHNNILFCELSFSNIMGSIPQPNNGSFRNWSVKKTTPSTYHIFLTFFKLGKNHRLTFCILSHGRI